MSSTPIKIRHVRGVEGDSLYINDYRVAGPKPWGGGPTVKEWIVELADLEARIAKALGNQPEETE